MIPLPLPWLKALPWIIAAVMAFAAAGALHLYLAERDEFTAYKAKVTQAQDDQARVLKDLDAQRETNLKQVRQDYEAKVSVASRDAVRTYCLRNPALCQPAARVESPAGQPLDDGAKPELVAPDPEFIRTCTRDAAKLGAWQDYCKRNNCPVEE